MPPPRAGNRLQESGALALARRENSQGGGLESGGDGLGVPMTPPAGPHSRGPVLWVSESVGQRGLVSRHNFRSAAPRLGGRGHVVLPGNKPPP